MLMDDQIPNYVFTVGACGQRTLANIEQDVIKQTMRRLAGRRVDVANALGISVRCLYSKLKKYGE